MLENEEAKMKFRIVGEGHTFSNALRKRLHQDDNIETAAYKIDHPLLSEPEFYVETEGEESVKEALVKAAEDLKEDYEEIEKELDQALEQ